MSTDTALHVGYDLTLGLDGNRAVGSVADDGCCSDPLCVDYCKLACSFVNILPNGPMWDTQKQKALDAIVGGGDYNPCEPYVCPIPDKECVTMATYAVYGARVLHDMVFNILKPSVSEASPYSASATLDDWLERYGWEDCYRSHCRSAYAGVLSPYERDIGGCTVFCETNFSSDFECALKHNILRSLVRAQRGVIKNLDGLNWIIAPLGAVLTERVNDEVQSYLDRTEPCEEEATEGKPCWCNEVEFEICNSGERINVCPKPNDDCVGTQATILARRTYTCEGETQELYPGVIAAECIVRSLLVKQCPNIIFRCDPPEPEPDPIVVPDFNFDCSSMNVSGDAVFTAGEQPVVSITVCNSGTEDSGPFTVVLPFPEGTRANAIVPGITEGGVYDLATNSVTWSLPNAPAGGVTAYILNSRFIVEAGAASGLVYTTEATITSDTQPTIQTVFTRTNTAP